MPYDTIIVDETPSNVLPAGKAGVALATGDLVYRDSNGVWQLAVSVDPSSTRTDAEGICWKDVQANEQMSAVKKLILRGFTGLTIGAKQYLSATGTTGNTITETKPTVTIQQTIGVAVLATEIVIDVKEAKEMLVLVGAAQGTTALSAVATNLIHQVHGIIASAAGSNWYVSSYGTLTLTATQTNNVSTFAAAFEHYITGGTIVLNGNLAAVWGNLEISGTSVSTAGSTSTYMAGVLSTIVSTATALNIHNITGGFVADSVITDSGVSVTAGGAVLAAFVAHVNPSHSTTRKWDCGLYLLGCDNVLGFNGAASAYANGVKIAAITNVSTTASGCMRVRDYLNSTYYYIPLWAAGDLDGE